MQKFDVQKVNFTKRWMNNNVCYKNTPSLCMQMNIKPNQFSTFSDISKQISISNPLFSQISVKLFEMSFLNFELVEK